MPSKVCGSKGCYTTLERTKCLKAMLFIGIALTTIGALGFSEKYFTCIFRKSIVARNLTLGSGITLTLYSGFKILRNPAQESATLTMNVPLLRDKVLRLTEPTETTEEAKAQFLVFNEAYRGESKQLLEKCQSFLTWPFHSKEEKAIVRTHIEEIRACYSFITARPSRVKIWRGEDGKLWAAKRHGTNGSDISKHPTQLYPRKKGALVS